MHIHLTLAEQHVLMDTHGEGVRKGGFQSLMKKLRSNLDATGALQLDEFDLERIPRYAFKYKGGGWQDRLLVIFSRTLGPDLARCKFARPSRRSSR